METAPEKCAGPFNVLTFSVVIAEIPVPNRRSAVRDVFIWESGVPAAEILGEHLLFPYLLNCPVWTTYGPKNILKHRSNTEMARLSPGIFAGGAVCYA